MRENPWFLNKIVETGIVSPEGLQRLQAEHGDDAQSILNALIRNGIGDKKRLGRLWGDSIEHAYVDLNDTLFQREIVSLIPEEFARENNIIPLYRINEVITAATSHPDNFDVIVQAEKLSNSVVNPVFAFSDEIQDAIEINYSSVESLQGLSDRIPMLQVLHGEGGEVREEELEAIAGNEAVIEFVQGIMLLALKHRASDIHLEPDETQARVRFRVDGILQERMRVELSLLEPITARLKLMANVNIADHHRPQDGRIKLQLQRTAVDFRFSAVPTIYGEKLVLRVLGQADSRDAPALEDMNFSKTNYDLMRRMISHPNGIIFVTGPTGSGKTTTLFAVLRRLNTPNVNIMTVEDPVEYRLQGVNQVQIRREMGVDFAAVLRSFLRQDPDIILAGEIRDLETAHIALQAALTGHLVLSTLHTNDAIQAVTRLVDIGIKPYHVAPSVVGVLAQRLVRRICPHCKESYAPDNELIDRLFEWDGLTDVRFYRGLGCYECNHSGYLGRLAIHEIMPINEEIRSLISQNARENTLRQCAVRHGYQTLRYDCMKKVLRGLTTIDEMERVTVGND